MGQAKEVGKSSLTGKLESHGREIRRVRIKRTVKNGWNGELSLNSFKDRENRASKERRLRID